MNNSLLTVACMLAFVAHCFSQSGMPDTTQVTSPTLEIPEITIVGKKAITLPFARKGEIYDVNLYQAPAPDSSLLGERLATAMPVGVMPREEEKRVPFHAAVEGTFGSFALGKLRAYLDYTKGQWKFFGNTGFGTTEGHVDNAKGSSFDAAANAQTLLMTDNNVLKSLMINGGISLSTETYGMFTYPDYERSRQKFSFDASLGSIDRRNITIDLGIKTKFWSITDKYPSVETEATAVSPTLSTAFGMNIGKTRWETGITFNSISLDYSIPTQSVTLFSIESSLRWNISERWTALAGIVFSDGSDLYGMNRTIALPTFSLLWKISEQQQFSFKWKPMMELRSYDDWMRYNPYLVHSLDIEPERAPVNLGIGYSSITTVLTLEAGISYTQYSNKAAITGMGIWNMAVIPPGSMLTIVKELWLQYYEADQTTFNLDVSYKPVDRIRTIVSGALQPTYASGSSDQLSMVPLVTLNGRIEYDFPKPITLFSSFDYMSSRNNNIPSGTDLMLIRTIDGAFLLHAGVSTTLLPRTVLTASIRNLLATSYDWWADYPAPGFQFLLEAKVNLR